MKGASNLPLGSHYEAAGFYIIIDGPHFTSTYVLYCLRQISQEKICNKHFTIKFEVFEFCEEKKFFGCT